ncbi:Maturation and nuclear export of 40S ribosomal subunits interacting protein [Saitoella coloradoensis]
MPGVIGKRKRVADTVGAVEKPKKTVGYIKGEIATLEEEINESAKNYNHFAALLNYCGSKNGDIVHAATAALYRLFATFLKDGKLVKPAENDKSPTATVALWLRGKYVDYSKKLCTLLDHPEAGVQLTALTLLLRLLKDESVQLSESQGSAHFANDHYMRTVEAVLYSSSLSDEVRDVFVTKHWNVHDDLRFYFMKNATKLAEDAVAIKDEEPERVATFTVNLHNILSALRTMPTDESEINEFWTTEPKASKKKTPQLLDLSVHKKTFQECWLAALRLPLTMDLYKNVLLIMHKRIVVHMPKPQLLMDFLTDSYNAGGPIALLALNGLFQLMQSHNLDYPNFFKQLYYLFDRNLMHVRYRSRFVRLVDLFLSSTHLPAGIAASFIKRMSRLSLTAPPAAIVIIIPFTYNLLKRHPTCMTLIHKMGEITTGAEDPFDPEEPEPLNSRALESSLWELATLQNHYHPNVATLAKILQEQFTKPSYNLEDFLDHNYSTMLDAELTRHMKKVPAIEFEAPKSVFCMPKAKDGEEAAVVEVGPVLTNWEF